MKLSELIQKLQEIEAKEGDVEMYLKNCEGDTYPVEGVEFNNAIYTGDSTLIDGEWVKNAVMGWVIE